MPKFSAGCHYNDEEISPALEKKKKKKKKKILAGPNERQEVCNRSKP
jgi:hypothetical protein